MPLTSNQKTLLVVLAVMWLLYFFNRPNKAVQNDGSLEAMSGETPSPVVTAPVVSTPPASVHTETNPAPPAPVAVSAPAPDFEAAAQEAQLNMDKFKTRNHAPNGDAHHSYHQGRRAQTGSWQEVHSQSNNLIAQGMAQDDQDFVPVGGANQTGAPFASQGGEACGSNQNCSPEELYDSSKYLPQEVNNAWFDTQHEPVSVKNRHLINVTRPIGVSTVAGSMKNPSLDIRGNEPCSKFVVSPWLQSSIEPDFNIKPLN